MRGSLSSLTEENFSSLSHSHYQYTKLRVFVKSFFKFFSEFIQRYLFQSSGTYVVQHTVKRLSSLTQSIFRVLYIQLFAYKLSFQLYNFARYLHYLKVSCINTHFARSLHLLAAVHSSVRVHRKRIKKCLFLIFEYLYIHGFDYSEISLTVSE